MSFYLICLHTELNRSNIFVERLILTMKHVDSNNRTLNYFGQVSP